MRNFTINNNSYLDRDVKWFCNCDYIGYGQKDCPDFINRLKNMTKAHKKDLVEDFIEVTDRATKDLKRIIETNLENMGLLEKEMKIACCLCSHLHKLGA